MLQLCDRMDQEFVRIVSQGRGHAEEQALATVHARNPQDFHMFYGDYYEQTINYVSIAQNAHAVISFFIDRAVQDNGWEWAADACAKLSDAAYNRKTITLSPDQASRLNQRIQQAATNTNNPALLRLLTPKPQNQNPTQNLAPTTAPTPNPLNKSAGGSGGLVTRRLLRRRGEK